MNRQEFFEKVHTQVEPKETFAIVRAYWFAKEAHRRQKRDSGERYFEHCRAVACILMEHGPATTDEIILALLHDCEEDGFYPPAVLEALFGVHIANSVRVLSKKLMREDPLTGTIAKEKKDDKSYWVMIENAGTPERRVKCADRLHNLRNMGVWPSNRIQKYILETETHVFPLAWHTDLRLHEAIRKECETARLS